MFCSKCGKEINAKSVFCSYCGSKVEIEIPEIGTSTISNIDDRSEEEILREYEQEKERRIRHNTSEYYFNKFKITVILFYFLSLLFAFLLDVTVGEMQNILKVICCICILTLIGIYYYYVWVCSKLVGKSFFLYIFLSIILSVLSPLIIYLMLKYSYNRSH